MGSETEHILMVPFMAQGHLRPFLDLAYRLHSRTCFTITILTTPLNAQSLRRKLPTTTTRITVAELPFNPSDHGLPPGIENTDKLSDPTHRLLLLNGSIALEPHLRHFLHNHHHHQQQPFRCVIFDHLMGWVAPVARSFGSMAVAFTTCGAYGTAAMLSFWSHLPHRGYSDDQSFPLPGFPVNHRFSRCHLSSIYILADGSDDLSRYFQSQFRLIAEYSSGWLCNSVEEIEPIGFEIFRNYVKLPVWAIGPMIPSLTDTYSPPDEQECIQWLSTQEPDSVLYISFGSQSTISLPEMKELATGLELSGKPFLWVIRPPIGFDIGAEFEPEWLPEGFEDRMRQKKQGILVQQWGPQVEILRHSSTEGFLSHCGWNSVLEALREGVPIIGWPLAAEQPYNLRMLREEIGVATEFEGKVCKEEVKRVVEMVLERGEGSYGLEMKKRAVEMGNRLKDAVREEGGYKGSSIKAMDGFVDAILSSASRQTI